MKISLTYGFLLALGGALLTFALFFLGFHSATEKLAAAQWIGSLGGLAISWTLLYLGLNASRAQAAATDRDWLFGPAFGQGFMIVLVGALLGVIFSYIYFASINPDFVTMMRDAQTSAMEEKGFSPEKIERAQGMVNKLISAPALSFFAFVGALVNGTLLALHLALTMIRRHARTALLRYYALIGLPLGLIVGFFQGVPHGHALLWAGLGLVVGPLVEIIVTALALAVANYTPAVPAENEPTTGVG